MWRHLSRTRQQSSDGRFLRLAADSIFVIEFVVLDLIGVALIWAGGWVEGRCRCDGRGARARAERAGSPS